METGAEASLADDGFKTKKIALVGSVDSCGDSEMLVEREPAGVALKSERTATLSAETALVLRIVTFAVVGFAAVIGVVGARPGRSDV